MCKKAPCSLGDQRTSQRSRRKGHGLKEASLGGDSGPAESEQVNRRPVGQGRNSCVHRGSTQMVGGQEELKHPE